jgi:hypothetical protein
MLVAHLNVGGGNGPSEWFVLSATTFMLMLWRLLPSVLLVAAGAGGSLKGEASVGAEGRDQSIEKILSAILERGVLSRVYPGAVALVGNSQGVLTADGGGQ